MRLPKLPPSSEVELRRYAEDLADVLRGIPDSEYKQVQVAGNFPQFLSTRIGSPIEVRRVQTFETKNSANGVTATGIAWRKSSDPRQIGVVLLGMDGLTPGIDYTVGLMIVGL
jgi:hypothetical protein